MNSFSQSGQQLNDLLQTVIMLYAQDTYHLTPKLVANFGLRWDTDLPHTERYNRLSYFDPDAPSSLAGKAPGFPNLKGAMKFVTPDHRRQTPTDLNNWGPRFGFAYKINPKTVFRGAYGILYGVSVMQAAGVSGSSGTEGFRGSTNFTASVDGREVPFATMANPFALGLNLRFHLRWEDGVRSLLNMAKLATSLSRSIEPPRFSV